MMKKKKENQDLPLDRPLKKDDPDSSEPKTGEPIKKKYLPLNRDPFTRHPHTEELLKFIPTITGFEKLSTTFSPTTYK
jgi:hypothetical protein